MQGPTLAEIILGILPMVVLIGGVYILVRLFGGRSKQDVALEVRKAEALERIATALEKRQ